MSEIVGIGHNTKIVLDDVNTKIGYLMGAAENVSEETINFMTHFGKGLIYVCITEEKARKLELPIMGEENGQHSKTFSISVDYKTTTTGISALERSDTINAFTQSHVKPEDFKRPGHVFPLITKEKTNFDHLGIADVAVWLNKLESNSSEAYVCEILNKVGEVADRKEIEQLSQQFNLPIVLFSEVIQAHYQNTNWLTIIDSHYIDRNKNILEYTVNNKLSQKGFKMFIRQGESQSNQVVYYEKCLIGDLLGSNQCTCKAHFKDYYNELENEEIDAIIYYEEPADPSSDLFKKEVINKQLNWLITEIYQMNQRIKTSNF